MSANTPISQAFDTFVQQYCQVQQPQLIEYDPAWPSDCYQQSSNVGEMVPWQPVLRAPMGNFDDLEKALDMSLDPQLKVFFGRYWSDNLDAKTARGSLQLLQAWNADDFARLQQNMIGHVLMKRRLKQAETVFFALTDEDDFILSVEQTGGQVVLEQVGLEPREVLAENLSAFLSSLQPDVVK